MVGFNDFSSKGGCVSMKFLSRVREIWEGVCIGYMRIISSAGRKLQDKKGQGTTEYAILVGVLVVIAILAIVIFRPKLQELWDAISDGMSQL